MISPLKDASSLASPSSLKGKGASFVPGTFIVPKKGRPFNIVASSSRKEGQFLQISFLDGDAKSVSFKDLQKLPIKTAGEIRLANLFRFYAYNQDFDLYVKTSITEHGLPIDPKMHWAKWTESVFKGTITQEERRDEAIHNMLIHTLFDINILNNFDATRLSEGNQALPLAEQVTIYLKNYFLYQKSKMVKWISDTYGTSNELLIMDGGNLDTEDGPAPILEKGEEDEEQKVDVIKQVDLDKFRALFTKWMNKPSIREKVRDRVLACMEVILDTPAMKNSQLIEELRVRLNGTELSAKRVFHNEFPAFVQKFLQTPEGKKLSSTSATRTTEEPGTKLTSNMEEPMRSRRFADNNQYTKNPSPAASTAPAPGAATPTLGTPTPKQGKCTKCGRVGSVGTAGHCAACEADAKMGSRRRASGLGLGEEAKVTFKEPQHADEVEHTTITIDNERKLPSLPGEPEGSKIKVTAKYATLCRIAMEEPKELGHALKELTAAFTSLAEASEAFTENLDLKTAGEDAPISEKVASRKKYASSLRRIASENPEAVEEAVQELYHSLDEIAEAIENLASNLDIDLGVEDEEMIDDSEFGGANEELEGNEELEENEEGLDEFDEEIGSKAPDILDAYEEEKTSSRRRKRASGEESALMAISKGTCWDLANQKYAQMYLAKGPVYVLVDGGEPIAAYSPSANVYVDATDGDANEDFGAELQDLKGCIGE